ncbi:MAG: hypothetical protein JW986_04315, partial [Methanotrichaceae archaeon]|nr:hypothetical protein [Methanotrichaceae archaeon]
GRDEQACRGERIMAKQIDFEGDGVNWHYSSLPRQVDGGQWVRATKKIARIDSLLAIISTIHARSGRSSTQGQVDRYRF